MWSSPCRRDGEVENSALRAVTTSLFGQERGLVRKAIAILPVVSFLYQTCYNHVYLLFSSAKLIKVLFFYAINLTFIYFFNYFHAIIHSISFHPPLFSLPSLSSFARSKMSSNTTIATIGMAGILATLKPSALTHICANIILDSPNLLLNRMSSYDNLLLKYYLK